MTEPTGTSAPGPAPDGGTTDVRLPPEFRAARSLTDRSKAEEAQAEDTLAQPEPASGPRIWPRVVGVLILLFGVGGAWVWQNPESVPLAPRLLFTGSGGQDTEAAAIQALRERVARLEQRPLPVDLGSLIQRLDALEKRATPVAQSATQTASVDLRPLLARLDALEARPREAPQTQAEPAMPSSSAPMLVPVGADLNPVLTRLDALEKREPARAADIGRLEALSSRIDALSARDPSNEVRGRLDEVDRRLSELAARDLKLGDASGNAARLARVAAAQIALSAGHPLGPIPDAPAALTRFATNAPPTEAGLRLAFGTAAREAVKVSPPDTEGKPFLDRVLARLQDSHLITVREGDRVVIGNSAADMLLRARVLLDAGDMAGAIRTVAALTGPAAEKMTPWLSDAKALQAAREALASLAESG